jgi:hypothetical protein
MNLSFAAVQLRHETTPTVVDYSLYGQLNRKDPALGGAFPPPPICKSLLRPDVRESKIELSPDSECDIEDGTEERETFSQSQTHTEGPRCDEPELSPEEPGP